MLQIGDIGSEMRIGDCEKNILEYFLRAWKIHKKTRTFEKDLLGSRKGFSGMNQSGECVRNSKKRKEITCFFFFPSIQVLLVDPNLDPYFAF